MKSIREIFADGKEIDEALTLAFHDAVREHRLHNVPMSFYEDGKIVHVSPHDIPLPEDN